MSQLTPDLKRLIGQHFVLGFHTSSKVPSKEIKDLIEKYHLGNIILMKRNVQSAAQVRDLTDALQKLAKDAGEEIGLLVGTDQENGLVSAMTCKDGMTQFPGAMALAAIDDPQVTKDIYAATAKQLCMLGVNWAYSPVADVNSEMKNPVIGVRSFGDEPIKVAQQTLAASDGLASGGVSPSPKHFPGHGDTHVDSHLALPSINKSLSALHETELVPFKALTSAASIMTAHISLPNITGTDEPSTLSAQISTDLLRNELGFTGVLVTDCLEMDAIANLPGGIEEGAVRALIAGADIAMICHTYPRQVAAIERAWEAVESGHWSLDALKKSGERIKKMKQTFARPPPTFDTEQWEIMKMEHEVLSKKAYERSICVLSDPSGILPLSPDTSVSLWTPEPESINKAVDDAEGVERSADEEGILRSKTGAVRNTASASFLALQSSIKARAAQEGVQHMVYHQDGTFTGLHDDRDVARQSLVFVLRNADRSTWQLDQLRSQLSSGNYKGVVVLSCSTPYDLVGQDLVEERGLAHVASFEYTPAAFEATAKVLFGEVKPSGKCPVKLA